MTERAPCLLCGKVGSLDTSGAFPVLTHDPGDRCGIGPGFDREVDFVVDAPSSEKPEATDGA